MKNDRKTKSRGAEAVRREKWAFRAKHKVAGRVFISLLIGALILGAVSAYLILAPAVLPLVRGGARPAAQAAVGAVGASDSFTMLLTVYDDTDAPVQLMLLRVDAANSRLDVMPVPLELEVKPGGNVCTLSSELANDGAGEAIDSLQTAAGIKIDYRCGISAGNLSTLIGLFGGFVYNVPDGYTTAAGLQPGNSYIDGEKALALIAPGAAVDNSRRYEVQAGLMKAFAQQRLTGQCFENGGTFFKNVFNLVSTDFSMNDLLTSLKTLKAVTSRPGFVTALVPGLNYSPQGGENMCTYNEQTLAALKAGFGRG